MYNNCERERSWISSSGTFVVFPMSYRHQDYVSFLNEKKYVNIEDAYFDGWARVVGVGADLYICKPKCILEIGLPSITSCQKDALIDLCLFMKKQRLIYDDENEEKTIWSLDDKL
jgi:hypothetical protein